MVAWYVYDGGDNDPGYGPTDRTDPSQADNWTNAFQLIATADTAASDGDIIYVASDHSETVAGIQLALNYSVNDKAKFISIKRSDGSFETMVTGGGSLATNNPNDVAFQGKSSMVGIYLDSGDDIILNSLAGGDAVLELCKFQANDDIRFASGEITHSTKTHLLNCELLIDTTGRFAVSRTHLVMRGGSITSSVAMTDTSLFHAGAEGTILDLSSVDMSGVYANTGLIKSDLDRSNIVLKRCKLWTGFNIPTPLHPTAGTIKCHSCDTGDGYWYFHEVSYYGAVTQATNCYLNATYDGTNGFSAKMVSSANSEEYTEPLRFKLCDVYADANSTFTVEIIGTATLQNDEFWVEIESNDATDEAFGDIVDTRPATILTAPANLTTSTAAWTEDLGSEIKQKIAKTISGGFLGIVTIWACLAKPSTTVYVDPDVTVS